MEVTGFHGTSRASAAKIVTGEFRPSRNEYDWLGEGVYFFQDAPQRALDWARERFGREAAVVMAMIDLDGCMDLLDLGWEGPLSQAYYRLEAEARANRRPLPHQSVGAHRLDAVVINLTADRLAEVGRPLRSVRAVFVEGEPLFPGSALAGRAHVQVAVRDRSAIRAVSMEVMR